MHEDTTFDAPGVGGGISRRDMLRKSAVVGGAGALMWAAPSITKYGSAAFGSEGTPITGFSWAAAVVNCGTGDIRVKYELDDGGFEDDPGELPNCESGGYSQAFIDCWYAAAKMDVADWPFDIHVSQSGDILTFDLGDYHPTCKFVDCGGTQGGVVMGGTVCDSNSVTLSADGKTLSFDVSQVGGDVKNA